MKTYNPKALNLEKLRYSDKRVTLGFKCSPKLKLDLAEIAELRNISLSEYVEWIVVNLPKRNIALRKEVDELSNRLAFFEDNPTLLNILNREFGKEHALKTADNEILKIKINNVRDVFEIMVNSFKSL